MKSLDELPGISLSSMLCLNSILLLAFALQSAVFYASNHNEALLPVLLTNFGVAIVLGVYTWVSSRYQADIRNPLLACVLVLFLGPAGCFIAMICCTFNYIISRNARKNFSEWLFTYLYSSDAQESGSDRLYQRIIAGQEAVSEIVDTEPLADIMESGSIEQKQQAVVKAVKYFNPAMVPVLQAGLHDLNNQIRVQSAGALAKLQDSFHKRYVLAELKFQKGKETPEDLVQFAGICEDYARSGLLDSEKKAEAIKRSIALYERCIAVNPANAELKMSLIRMLMINKEFERALQILRDMLPALDNPSPVAKATALELLFMTRSFAELRSLSGRWMKGRKYEILLPWAENGMEPQRIPERGA